MITVWGRKTSSNVQALMWCLGELGLAYRRHDVGHKFGGTDTAQFEKLNPNRTVPVIQDGNNSTLWETGAILRYLSNAYADDSFWPKKLLLQTEVDRWAEWAKVNIASEFTVPIFWRVVRTKPADRDLARIQQSVSSLEQKLRIADAQLRNHSFLAGESFTLADIQFGHVLFRYYDIDIERADLQSLAEYYDRLRSRPAFQEHVMVSYEELRVA